jgi:hypothetical protein
MPEHERDKEDDRAMRGHRGQIYGRGAKASWLRRYRGPFHSDEATNLELVKRLKVTERQGKRSSTWKNGR